MIMAELGGRGSQRYGTDVRRRMVTCSTGKVGDERLLIDEAESAEQLKGGKPTRDDE